MHHRPHLTAITSILLITLACGGTPTPIASNPAPTPSGTSVFESGHIAYGFFPTPPQVTLESVLKHFEALGDHADFVLVQENIPWDDFVNGVDGKSQKRIDIRNLMTLANQQSLDAVFVVDPLNGLNRREFMGLPSGWDANFANPDVRTAFTNFTLWLVREFHPRYLGLASEINTYANAHPDDFPNYVSLYHEVYALVKAESPDTQIFVTFQWEELNNLFAAPVDQRQPNWEQVEIFEPNLDLWVISSYPFVVFKSGAEIPADYYTPLLTRTTKPLAVAEGGFTSEPVGSFSGTPQDQVDYLNAIHTQIGERLTFWTYLLLNDFDPESYGQAMRDQGLGSDDIETLGFFVSVGLREADGTPKPALTTWDNFRNSH